MLRHVCRAARQFLGADRKVTGHVTENNKQKIKIQKKMLYDLQNVMAIGCVLKRSAEQKNKVKFQSSLSNTVSFNCFNRLSVTLCWMLENDKRKPRPQHSRLVTMTVDRSRQNFLTFELSPLNINQPSNKRIQGNPQPS